MIEEGKDPEETTLPGVHSGYYYGGYYIEAPSTDGVWNVDAAQTVDGREVKPQGGETFWVKEVDAAKYLKSYFKYTYVKATKRLTGLWYMSDLDDRNYQETGFAFWDVNYTTVDAQGNETVHSAGDDDDVIFYRAPVTKAYKSLTVYPWVNGKQDTANAVTVYPKDLSTENKSTARLTYYAAEQLFADVFGQNADKTGVFVTEISQPRNKASFTIIPYWVTIDGIPVVANNKRVITIHPAAKTPAGKADGAITANELENVLAEFEDESGSGTGGG